MTMCTTNLPSDEVLTNPTLADVIAALGEPLSTLAMPQGGTLIIYPQRVVPLGCGPMMSAALGWSEDEQKLRRGRRGIGARASVDV